MEALYTGAAAKVTFQKRPRPLARYYSLTYGGVVAVIVTDNGSLLLQTVKKINRGRVKDMDVLINPGCWKGVEVWNGDTGEIYLVAYSEFEYTDQKQGPNYIELEQDFNM